MKILVTGSTGFIGRHIANSLVVAGHDVLCVVRNRALASETFPYCTLIEIDFARASRAEDFFPHLAGVDTVINTVGIFTELGSQTFKALHEIAPSALFAACVPAGVRRVIQISALGANARSESEFLLSKHRADSFLLQQPLSAAVLQPAPIFGEGGASAKLFQLLALSPVLALPDGGKQIIQPVHIDDLCTAILRLIDVAHCGRIAAVGAQPVIVRDYIAIIRRAMQYRPARVISLSSRVIGKLPHWVQRRWLSPDTLALLRQSKIEDESVFREVLGRSPLAPPQFMRDATATARKLWLMICFALLRSSIALVWVFTGVVSAFIFPTAESYELLARSGVPTELQPLALYGAAALDIAFGIATLALSRCRRWLWIAQMLLIGIYSLIITLRLPEFWLHPYGPMLKNLPMLGAIFLLYTQEPRRRRKPS